MKTRLTLTLLLLLFISSALKAQNGDISGEWKINREKSAIGDVQLLLCKINIKLKADSILTTRFYENATGEYPFDENLALDGSEAKITIYDMPRSSKATIQQAEKTISITSTTSFNAGGSMDDMIANEKWKLDESNGLLTLVFTNKMQGMESTGTYYYERVK